MLLRSLITIALISPFRVFCVENVVKEKPYAVFPVPFELPSRNDRSEQCWLRVEDVELTETVAIYCYIAQGFLRNYIHDYNSKKMTEDDVDVSLWSEEPRTREDILPKYLDNTKDKDIKDWKLTTVLDPITRMRLYVTQQAVCRLIMYSREGMTNYKINCDKILYYINDRMNGSSKTNPAPIFALATVAILVRFLFIVI